MITAESSMRCSRRIEAMVRRRSRWILRGYKEGISVGEFVIEKSVSKGAVQAPFESRVDVMSVKYLTGRAGKAGVWVSSCRG